MIDPKFRNINKLFILSFKTGNNDPTKTSFVKYHMSLVEIKDFNVLVDNKPFFDYFLIIIYLEYIYQNKQIQVFFSK